MKKNQSNKKQTKRSLYHYHPLLHVSTYRFTLSVAQPEKTNNKKKTIRVQAVRRFPSLS